MNAAEKNANGTRMFGDLFGNAHCGPRSFRLNSGIITIKAGWRSGDAADCKFAPISQKNNGLEFGEPPDISRTERECLGGTIAALYVQAGGCYYGIPGVDPWDEERDARTYAGPWPVVAHPPCQRWGKMWKGQPGNIKRGKVEKLGDDGGCFKAALSAVRRFGGVLEHPEHSHAWRIFGMAKPPRHGGWIKADDHGGWTCRVEQGQYGHYCPKPTWLYAVGVDPLPELRWGVYPVKDEDFPPEAVERHGIKYCRRAGLMAFMGGGKNSAPRIATPPEFRDLLINMARMSVGGAS